MIVNNKDKFVFIHIPKTAGLSLEKAINGKYVSPRHEYVQNIKSKHDGFFIFTFVRNPWARLHSIHTFGINGGWISQKNFRTWLLKEQWWEAEETRLKQDKERLPWQIRPMSDWISANNEIVVDFIGRFENLQKDIDVLRTQHNIKIDALPHLNRTSHSHYSEVYDNEMREFVEHHHKIDIINFGYTFNEIQ